MRDMFRGSCVACTGICHLCESLDSRSERPSRCHRKTRTIERAGQFPPRMRRIHGGRTWTTLLAPRASHAICAAAASPRRAGSTRRTGDPCGLTRNRQLFLASGTVCLNSRASAHATIDGDEGRCGNPLSSVERCSPRYPDSPLWSLISVHRRPRMSPDTSSAPCGK